MIKFLLVIQICSAVHGDCLPKQNVGTYDSWFSCAKAGTQETIELIELVGEELINNNKIYVSFSCQTYNEV